MCRIQFVRFLKSIAFSILFSFSFGFLYGQVPNQIFINDDIQLVHLKDSIFAHVSLTNMPPYGRFPSNGMLIVKNGEAIMIDTPMDNQLTMQLLSFIEDSLQVELTKLIVGHFHDDCLGGLEYIQSKNIPSLANLMTIEKCKELGLPIPTESFHDSLIFNFNGLTIDCRFFGGGHSADNITVYLPDEKILFGGCLIRAMEAQSLGNLADARVDQWVATVATLKVKYPEVEIVVPGHGNSGSPEMLTHTIDLVNSYLSIDK